MNSQPNTQIILGIISIILISTLLIANIEHPDGNMLDLTTIGIIIIVILVVIQFIYLNHYTQKTYGNDQADDYFSFPLNFITAMATVAFIIQIVFQMHRQTKADKHDAMFDLNAYTTEVVIRNWETDPVSHPALNKLYESIFSYAAGGNGQFMTKSEWQAKYPHITYVPYVGNERQWHFSAKFCQHVTNVVRMFKLDDYYLITDLNAKATILNSPYAGWLTSFQSFMSYPIVRNVWEQYKFRHANPKLTAWVQHFILDEIDNNPDFFNTNKAIWQQHVENYLSGKSNQVQRELKQN